MKMTLFSFVSILLIAIMVVVCHLGDMYLTPYLYIIILWVLFGLNVLNKKSEATIFSHVTLLSVNFSLVYVALFYSALNFSLPIWVVIIMLSIEFFISGLEMMACSMKRAVKGGGIRKIHWVFYHVCALLILFCGLAPTGEKLYLFIGIVTLLMGILYFAKYSKILLDGQVGNLPNMLTLLRIVLMIPFIICFFIPNFMWAALIIFVVASVTDFFDGYLARKHNLVTNFGKIMDPLADKVLVMAALILFTTTNLFPMWAIIILLFREVYVTYVRISAAKQGNVIAAGKSGKLKTVIQMVTIIVLFILPGGVFAWVFVVLTIILTIYSGLEYMVANRGFLQSEVK